MTFKYVSLFSGVGGFEQALNKLGGNCVFASEIDKFASKAYATLYGEDHLHGDVTKIDAKDVPDHDLLVGGFPCQAFSVAGKRGGFEDSRGTLFFEMARIAKEKQPKVILAENVKGLVGHDKGRTLDTIVKTLNDIGYRVDFEILNSKYFGVPQNRERIFIVAVREDLVENEPWENVKGATVVPKGKRRISGYEDVKTFNFDWPEQGEVTTRLRDVLEAEVDEKYYLSEDKTAKLVAQLEEKDKTVGTVGHHPFSKKYEFNGYNSEISPSLIATDYKAPKTVLEGEPQMLGHVDIKGHDSLKRVYSTEGQAPTLTTMGGGHREPKIAEQHSLDAGMYEGSTKVREDGLSSTLTAQDRHGVAIREIVESDVREIASKTRQNTEIGVTYKDNGDIRPHRMDARKSGISELQINHEDNPSNTVTSAHAPKTYGQSTRYRIRKLTPLECFRLQGFPDEVHAKLVEAGISDSQRYKQAGNAVTVNVIHAIGERLLPLLGEAERK